MTSEYYKVIPLYCNLWTLQFLVKGQNILNMSFAKIRVKTQKMKTLLALMFILSSQFIFYFEFQNKGL